MSFKLLTPTSAIHKGEIIQFYPCIIEGVRFLYCEENITEIAKHQKEIFDLAGEKLWSICELCSSPFQGKNKGAKFCSPYCRMRNKKINDKIKQGQTVNHNIFKSGYYTVERKGDIYTVTLRSKKIVFRLLKDYEPSSCIWMPKYTPLVLENDKIFFLLELEDEIKQKNHSPTSFLKVLLGADRWK